MESITIGELVTTLFSIIDVLGDEQKIKDLLIEIKEISDLVRDHANADQSLEDFNAVLQLEQLSQILTTLSGGTFDSMSSSNSTTTGTGTGVSSSSTSSHVTPITRITELLDAVGGTGGGGGGISPFDDLDSDPFSSSSSSNPSSSLSRMINALSSLSGTNPGPDQEDNDDDDNVLASAAAAAAIVPPMTEIIGTLGLPLEIPQSPSSATSKITDMMCGAFGALDGLGMGMGMGTGLGMGIGSLSSLLSAIEAM